MGGLLLSRRLKPLGLEVQWLEWLAAGRGDTLGVLRLRASSARFVCSGRFAQDDGVWLSGREAGPSAPPQDDKQKDVRWSSLGIL